MLNEDMNRFLGVLSYPFVSLDFLEEDFLQSYYELDKPKTKDKAVIRNRTVQFIRQLYHVYSYDEIYLYLEKWYLYPIYNKDGRLQKKNSFDCIFEHLQNLCCCLLSQRDGQIVYKYWENEKDAELLGGFAGSNKIYLFHSLNRLFVPDILAILYMVSNGKKKEELNGFYGNICVSDALLDRVFEKGVAENHLHSGVSASFLTIWDDWMKPLKEKDMIRLRSFELNNIYGMTGTELKYYLWLAGLWRAAILVSVKQDSCKSENDCHYAAEKFAYLLNQKGSLKKQYFSLNSQEYGGITMEQFFLNQWEMLFLESMNQTEQTCYVRTMTGVSSMVYTSDENLFLYEVLSWLYPNQDKYSAAVSQIKILFLNYLRIKNFFYQLTVQQKTIHGLDYFQLHYSNNSYFGYASAHLEGEFRWERIIREQLQNKNLQKLELRASVPAKESILKKEICFFLKAYRNILQKSYCVPYSKHGEKKYKPAKPFPKVGIVLHLLKREQDYLPEKCSLAGAEDAAYFQYGRLYEEYKNQIMVIKILREELKLNNQAVAVFLDKYLIGLDVASLENAVPTWVFAPIYEQARDSKIEPLQHVSNRNQSFQSLGFTFHAGEDFRHLLSGLRRIYEVVKYLKFHAGDRIGHGIALGISPENWFLENPTIIIPRIEALENYLWAYHMFSSNCTNAVLVNLAYLEKKIYELSRDIYGSMPGINTNLLVSAYIGLFENNLFECKRDSFCNHCEEVTDMFSVNYMPALCRYFYEKRQVQANPPSKTDAETLVWDIGKLLTARHCKKFVHKMNEPIHYRVTKQDLEITKEAQQIVKQYMSQSGIVVEVNPSSNITISDIDTLSQNQIYSLNQYSFQIDNMSACINTDDPSVFNTNVSNELAYIYFGMLERGVSRENCLLWIDKLRETGMNASFIRRKDSDEQILQELELLIKTI